MASFKKLYFYYPRYVFLAYLGYQLFLNYQSQEYDLSFGAAFLALTFPLAPVLVVAGEVYAFERADNPALGFLSAFGIGAFLFPSILCINLTIAMFAKNT